MFVICIFLICRSHIILVGIYHSSKPRIFLFAYMKTGGEEKRKVENCIPVLKGYKINTSEL